MPVRVTSKGFYTLDLANPAEHVRAKIQWVDESGSTLQAEVVIEGRRIVRESSKMPPEVWAELVDYLADLKIVERPVDKPIEESEG